MRALGQLWEQRVTPRSLDQERLPGPYARRHQGAALA
jgi:hypothetical protein